MPITRLSIQNLAIIENLTIEFDKGLNIITGETGAGKSIIISAISLILGQKPDGDIIRAGEDKLTVEAEFTGLSLEADALLKKNDIDNSEPLTVRREVSRNKRSRFFINDSSAPSELITALGNILIDIHGQHDHQSLLNKDSHINILDERAGISTGRINSLFAESADLKKEIEKMIRTENDLKDKKELLEYHYKEINEVSPIENEDETVSAELKKMESVDEIRKICETVTELCSGSDNPVLSKLKLIQSKCDKLSETDKQFEPFKNDLESAYQAVKEFSGTAELYGSSLEFDPEKYTRLSERYSSLKKLMKKFGPELSDVIKYFSGIKDQLGSMGSISFDKEKLVKKAAELTAEIEKECSRLTALREKGSRILEKEINSEFKDIGLQNAELKVVISKKEISPDGSDDVEFYIRTNIGEESKPLAKIASGGEISRVMLSIKNIISSEKGVGIAVFDEIDSGISGSVAEKVGKKLDGLAGKKQVIVITHLPAIASKGGTHFSVRKKIIKDRTVVEVVKLDSAQRIEEIASLITADKAGSDSKKLAKKLLED